MLLPRSLLCFSSLQLSTFFSPSDTPLPVWISFELGLFVRLSVPLSGPRLLSFRWIADDFPNLPFYDLLLDFCKKRPFLSPVPDFLFSPNDPFHSTRLAFLLLPPFRLPLPVLPLAISLLYPLLL